jgi:anti-anti-sigma regulatory factor
MGDTSIARERAGGRVTFYVAGTFDRPGAWRLRGEVDREVEGFVVLDFRQASDISDLALAVLAHGLTRARQTIRCRGLGERHLRVFRYCGVDVVELAAIERVEPLVAASPRPSQMEAEPV